jgi:hypothetical protein
MSVISTASADPIQRMLLHLSPVSYLILILEAMKLHIPDQNETQCSGGLAVDELLCVAQQNVHV